MYTCTHHHGDETLGRRMLQYLQYCKHSIQKLYMLGRTTTLKVRLFEPRAINVLDRFCRTSKAYQIPPPFFSFSTSRCKRATFSHRDSLPHVVFGIAILRVLQRPVDYITECLSARLQYTLGYNRPLIRRELRGSARPFEISCYLEEHTIV